MLFYYFIIEYIRTVVGGFVGLAGGGVGPVDGCKVTEEGGECFGSGTVERCVDGGSR